jgi:amino acid adenylation domain-containing protein
MGLDTPGILPPPQSPVSALDGLSTPALIAAKARLNPGAIALVSDSGQVTYAGLELQATQLAHRLHALGAGPEIPVALCCERSAEFVIAALAIMKCGAPYLPMDPAHPRDRLRFIIQDACVPLVVTRQDLAGHFSDLDAKIVALDAEIAEIAPQPVPFRDFQPDSDSLAYIIYTSGSSGQPKGVEVTHRNLSNLISWHIRAFDVLSSDRATVQAGVGFDAAVWEIWPYLTAGATLYLPDESTRVAAEALRDWMILREITISFVPTAIAEQLILLDWPAAGSLRLLLTGADTLQRYPAPGLPFALVNNYGPTECTVVATSGVIPPDPNPSGLPPIGRPIDHVTLHLLDEHLREVPPGAPGEICIGGAGVARGYRNRPDLTAERFIPDPFGNSGDRLYRTGDLGRLLPNGEILFMGRMDDQVKIRGYRIEPGEINALLAQHPSVQASAVIAREDTPGEKRLVGYVVSAPGAHRDESTLRDWVRTRLPDYMEPAAFVWIDSLPLTPNGKIDRAALPLPAAADRHHHAGFIAPRTPLEEALARIITEVLGISRVSVDDDFFALGGHSLLGAQVVARVRAEFGTELRLLDVFDAPTVAELAQTVEEALANQLDSMTDEEVTVALAALNAVPGQPAGVPGQTAGIP